MRIVEYTNRRGAAGPVQQPMASPDQLSGGGLGQGVATLGQGITNFAQAYRSKQQQDGRYAASQKASQFVLESDQAVSERISTFNPNEYKRPDGKPENWEYADDIGEELAKRKAEMLKDVTNPYERQELEARLSDANNRLVFDARKKQKAVEAEYVKKNAVSAQTNYANLARSNPNKLDMTLEMMNDYYDSLPDTFQHLKDGLKEESTRVIYDSALDGKVSNLVKGNNVSLGAISALYNEVTSEESPWMTNTSRQKYDQALDKLDHLRQIAAAKAERESRAAFDDEMDKIKRLGIDDTYEPRFTENSIRQMGFGKTETENMIRKLNSTMSAGRLVKGLKNMPFGEAESYLSEEAFRKRVQSAPPEAYNNIREEFDVGRKVLSGMQGDFKRDPVKFLSEQAEGYADYKADLFAKMEDPNFDPVESQEEIKNFVGVTKKIQQSFDPTSPPRILSKDDTQKIKHLLDSVTRDAQGGQVAYSVLSSEASKWGDAWPQIVQDLKADKAITGPDVVAASLMNQPVKAKLAEDLIIAGRMSEKELKAVHGDVRLSELSKEAAETLQPFIQSISGTVEAGDIALDYIESVKRLSLLYGGAKSAKQIVSDIVNDQYDYVSSGGSTIRVPKNKVQGVWARGTQMALDNYLSTAIDTAPIVPPPSLYGLKDKDARDSYIMRIKEGGRFINNGDEGVRLLDGNGQTVYMRDEDGVETPVSFTWEQVQDFAPVKVQFEPRPGQ